MSEQRMSQRESDEELRLLSFQSTKWMWLVLGIVEIIIGLRVLLLLIGVNPESPLAAFIYNLSAILLPFAGLVGAPAAGGMVLEISSIIAMLVYALLAWGIERIVWVSFYRPRGSVVGITQTTTSEPDIATQTTTREQFSEEEKETT